MSLAFAAIAGLASQVLIARDFGPAGLGVFSQTLTVFALVGQVAALGVHYSVLQRAAVAPDRDGAQRAVDFGVAVVLVVASLVATSTYFAAPIIGTVVSSVPLVESVRWVSIALVFHALTKVVAAGLNGTRRMSAFSGVMAARAGGMLVAVVALGVTEAADAGDLGVIFIASEFAALVVAIAAWGVVRPRWSVEVSRQFVAFGMKAAFAALTVEVNSRIDIAVLGIFASDEMVGVYALAATAFEGLLQVFVILRNQVNPHISAAIDGGSPGLVNELFLRLRRWTRLVSAMIVVSVSLFAGDLIELLGLSRQFRDAIVPLIILLIGLIFAAPLLPFDQALVVTGEPGAQSRVVGLSLIVNVVLNLALVPRYGLVGAAVGTACAVVTLALGVAFSSNRRLGTRLTC